MELILSILIGYAFGCVNPAYIMGKLRGIDIREKGSGNAGASNALVIMGKSAGVISAVLDILKAVAACRLAALLFPTEPRALIFAGVACVLGHIFPFYMHFRGGKGLASLAGTVLAYDWKLFLMMLAGAAVLVLIVNYICAIPLAGSVAFTAVYSVTTHEWLGASALILLCVVIWVRHIGNIKKILHGEELRFSYLWHPEKEKKRIAAAETNGETQKEESGSADEDEN